MSMSRVIPRAVVRGTASGVLFMAFFGTAWSGIGISGLQGWGNPSLPIVAVLIGVVIFICGITLIWSSRDIPNHLDEEDTRHSKRIRKGFGMTFGAEFALIGAAAAILHATHLFNYFFPVMAIIVGAHFFPLAHLFRVRTHYVTGVLVCLLAIVTVLFVPMNVTLWHHQIAAWSAFVGLGAALILWATGVMLWLRGNNLLNTARTAKQDFKAM
ncbi:hypothetical protein JZ785_16390 [Alicyclobacillus curvatus]|nr:hypothetical protein JZ785_16390 [Alicyclobacillus curvatus]